MPLGVTGKSWGETRALVMNAHVEIHRIRADHGQRCSRHHHATKVNAFFVESGILRIRIYQPNGIQDVTDLHAGDYTEVGAGVEHRFECLADCVAYEFYWPAMHADDIVRKDQGGAL